MPDITFTIELLETWVKKVKVTARTRSEAKMIALAHYHEEFQSAPADGIAFATDAEKRDVVAELEWPDGNPE